MSRRYDVISLVGDRLKGEGKASVHQRDVGIAICEDADIAEMWYMQYGKKLPHALPSRKRKMLFNDIQKYLNGEPVQGGSKGRGHRTYGDTGGKLEIVWNV